MFNIEKITHPRTSEVHGRSSAQIAEDQILHMMEINKTRARSRTYAVTMQMPIDQLNKSYKEWEEIIEDLIKSQDQSFAWLNNVNIIYLAFCDQVRRGK